MNIQFTIKGSVDYADEDIPITARTAEHLRQTLQGHVEKLLRKALNQRLQTVVKVTNSIPNNEVKP